MKTFKDLEPVIEDLLPELEKYKIDRRKLEFENGYGVSVVRGFGTYGNESGLYELGVTLGGSLCYTTSVTDDVIGYLSEDEVSEYMIKIQQL